MSRTAVIAHALSNDTAKGKAMITAGITTTLYKYGEYKKRGHVRPCKCFLTLRKILRIACEN